MRWPAFARTVSGQFVLLLIAALIVANVVTFAVLAVERERAVRDIGRGVQIERLIAFATSLATLEPAVRADLARAASTRAFRLSVGDAPAVQEAQNNAVASAYRERLTAALTQEFGTAPDVRVAVEQRRWHHGRQHWLGEDGPPRRFRRRLVDRIAASIQLPDQSWINLRASGRGGRRGPPTAPLLAILTSLLAVAAVGIWFIRRLTRPIRALADAADLAGQGDRSARVPENGPGEMRRAAAAFNGMQAKIAAFDQERARTIAAVGHDLRTPITGLRLRAEMVDDYGEREAMIRALGEMKVIADGLLTYGQSGAADEAVEPVDLSALLRALAADEPMLSFEGPTELIVQGRPVALARAFGNLAGNAVRYGGGGRISCAETPDAFVVAISDDGPGIDPDRLEAVFEPFVRLEESRSSETGGAGLGLSIARTLIRAHGGTIELRNRAAGGLDALVQLPKRRGS